MSCSCERLHHAPLMEWHEESTATELRPAAVLRDGAKVIAKVYLSPDRSVLRVVLPEMSGIDTTDTLERGQVKVDFAHKLIDFRRKP